MSTFVLKEHQDSFSTFYRDFTGRSLKKHALTGATGSVKREAGPTSSKDRPKVKVQKTEQPVGEGMGGQGHMLSGCEQLSTGLLASGQSLDSRTHMNGGETRN